MMFEECDKCGNPEGHQMQNISKGRNYKKQAWLCPECGNLQIIEINKVTEIKVSLKSLKSLLEAREK